MPWKESCPMDERMKFISRYLDGDKVTDLCHEFEISRKTAYKFIERFKTYGLYGLDDAKRGPRSVPHKTSDTIESLILKLREMRPTWGPKKLKARLEKLYPGVKIPATSTIGEILKRNGVELGIRKQRRKMLIPYTPLTNSLTVNDVWCIDFKGQFKLRNGNYCYPLTVSDHKSRFLISCEALPSTKKHGVRDTFAGIFSEFGLPKVILSDNGSPFASNGIGRLSQLSVWFLRLGINPEQIEPGHPEQNGRHERMHRTLKKEATRPAGKNLLQQQEKFDNFINIYNTERPHEALDMKTPIDFYKKSGRIFASNLDEINYDLCDEVRTVDAGGKIKVPGDWKHNCFIGRALYGEKLGLTRDEKNGWHIKFMTKPLGKMIKLGGCYKLT